MSRKIYVNNKRINIFQELRFKWFNIYYVEDQPFLLNNDGEKFYYSTDGDPIERVYFEHRGIRLGNIKLVWEEDVLKLADIVIFPPYQTEGRDFRGRGLGTAMFSLIKQIAVENRAKEIWGKMRPENPDSSAAWEQLKRFYSRQGCTIEGNIFKYFVQEENDMIFR